MQITFDEYLNRFGYSKSRIPAYRRCLSEFLSTRAADHYSAEDVRSFLRGKSRSIREAMAVVEKFLRLTLRLVEIAPNNTEHSLPVEQCVRDYLERLKTRGLSPNSIHYESYCLRLLQEYLDSCEIYSLHQVDKRVMSAFKNHVFLLRRRRGNDIGKQLDVRTQSTILRCALRFFDFLVKEGRLAANPVKRVSLPKKENRISRNHFTREEIFGFLHVIDTSTVYGFIDRTIFELLYSTGLRHEELRCVEVSDVNLEDALLLVRNGKGKKDRMCVLTPVAKNYLAAYLESVRSRHLMPGVHSPWLFPARSGKKLHGTYVGSRIELYRRRANITHHLSCHAFRRSFATHLLESGVDLRYIKELMGHENMNTTKDYIRINVRDLREMLLTHHPRERDCTTSSLVFRGSKRRRDRDSLGTARHLCSAS